MSGILSEQPTRTLSGARGSASRTEADRSRSRSQADEILQMLRSAGDRGCLSTELWEVARAAHSRVSDLRRRGHQITCTRESAGVYRYVLEADARPRSTPPAPVPQVKQSQPAPITAQSLPLFDGLGA